MRAMVLDFSRDCDDADIDTGIFEIPAPAPVKRPLTFSERGFSFIPLCAAHLELFSFLYGPDRNIPKVEECVGKVMIDRRNLPLGVMMVWLGEPDRCEREYGQKVYEGKCWCYADLGKWLKTYPTPILRAVKSVCDHLRKHEIHILHCTADLEIAGSQKLVDWLGGTPTGEIEENLGPVYRIDLRKTPL